MGKYICLLFQKIGKIIVAALAKIQSVQIDLDREVVGFGKVFLDKTVFDEGETIFGKLLREGTKRHEKRSLVSIWLIL